MKLNKTILFIVPYPENSAPSQRLKFEQYLPYFREAGYKVEFSSFMSQEFYKIVYQKGFWERKIFYTLKGYLKRWREILTIKKVDLIYLHLEAAPFGPPFFEWLYSFFKIPIIFDIDDMVMLKQSSVKGVKKTNWVVDFLRFRGKYKKIASYSNYIITVTKYINEYFWDTGKPIAVIPPTIDTDAYYVAKDRYIRREPFTLGWSGSYSTSQYLYLLEDVLRKLQEKYQCRIKVIGDENFRLDGVKIDAKKWELDREVEDLNEIDIGLYPLTEDPWVLGKGGLKALQYMAMGIPTVAQRIGVNEDIIVDGENGFLASGPEEWFFKIEKLLEDGKLRERIGKSGRKTVEEKYSLKVNAGKYLTIIEKTLAGRR